MAYNINAGNNTLCPRTYYVLNIGPNDSHSGHLISKISTKLILVTMKKHQPIHVPEDLIKDTNVKDLFNNKIQAYHFVSDYFIAQDDHYDNNVTVKLILMMTIILKMRVMMN